MASVLIHDDLRYDPRIGTAARALGISREEMLGHHVCLFWWAMRYAPNGRIWEFDKEVIAEASGWHGDAETYYAALQDAELTAEDDNGELFICGWGEDVVPGNAA